MNSLNIAVAGAGPAGLAAALALHRQGHHITIYDQFVEPRPVGSGLLLQPTGLAVLHWLGLGARMQELGAQIERLHGRAGGRVVLDVRYAAAGVARGLAVHRTGLFNVLHDAVKAAGIELKTSCKIAGLQGQTLVFDQDRKEGPFDLVIDALGSRSPLIRFAAVPDRRRKMPYGAIWASLPWPGDPFDHRALEQRYHQASFMAGVLPIGKRFEADLQHCAFFWSLKTADYTAWKAAGLAPWKNEVTKLWPETESLLNTITDPDQMTLASYDHHTLPLPFGRNLVFVGDSAHSTSPQLGQGANMALIDAYGLVAALKDARSLEQALASYASARRWHVRLYQALSYGFTPFYQSDSIVLPILRDNLVATVGRLPPVQRLLARIVAGQLGLPSRSLP